MKAYYLIIYILILSVVHSSCSDGEGGTPEPEIPASPKLRIELNSRDIATKAADDYTPTQELECIYDYYIYVVDATTGTVEVAITGRVGETVSLSNGDLFAASHQAVEIDDIEVEEGTKHVFAFANLDRIKDNEVVKKI